MAWRPSQANGWRPQVSVTPDGRIFITYGNAQCWLAELRRRGGDLELVRETLIDGARAWGGQWTAADRFLFWKEDPDVRNGWHIYQVTIALTPGAPGVARVTRLDVPIELAGGNANYAGPGDHWMAIRTGPGRVVVDGQIVHQGGGGAGSFAWPWYAHAAENEHRTLRVVGPGAHVSLHQTRADLHVSSIGANGKVCYGGFGDVRVFDPTTGQDERATLTPWRYETPQQVFHMGGRDWLVSATYDPGEDGQGWVLIRPEGFDKAIQHRVPVTDAHVAVLDDVFVVASAARGDLRVDLVPTNSALQTLPVRVPSPGRTVWAGAYYDSGRDGDFTPIGNCTVLSLANFSVSEVIPPDAPARLRAAARAAGAIFLGTSDGDLDAMRGDWGLVAGLVLGEHPTFREIEQDAAQARQRMAARGLPRRPIVATLMPDQPWAGDWRKPSGVDKLAVEFYLPAPAGNWHEQQRQASRRFDQVYHQAASAGLPLIMIAQTYDRAKAWPTPETRESLMPVYADLLAEQPIDGIWFFAHGRKGGLRDCPELMPWAKAIVASCPRPQIETLPGGGTGGGNNGGGNVAKPAITITEPNFPDEGIRIPAGGTLRCVWGRETGSGRIDKILWLLDGRVVADNPSDDPDHTFRDLVPGQHEIGARAIGPGGEHQTGKRRLVIVEAAQQPPPDPNPNPEPQPGKPMKNIISLKSLINGRVVCVDRNRPAPRSPHAIPSGGVMVLANRDGAGPWEQISLIHLPNDQIAFRGRTDDETTVLFCADTTVNARSPLLANREDRDVEAIGGYEAFTPERVTADDGSEAWAIKGHNGKYWRVDPADPEGRIYVDGDGAGPYERFASNAPLIRPQIGGGGSSSNTIGYVPPAGRMRQEGWALADDNGPRPMLSATLMDAETQFDQDRPRLAANVDYLVSHGVDFARILSEVDWPGKEANPRRAEQTVETVRFMWERGLRTELTIFGSHSQIDRAVKMDWTRVLCRALRDANLVEALALVEFINEGGGARVGPDECLEGLRIVQEFLPTVPRATTAPYDRDAPATTGFGERSEEYKEFMRPPATIATPHLDRGVNSTEGEYRICRQPWNALMMGYPYGNNEPAGPWASAQGANVMLDPNMQRVHCNGTWLMRGAYHCWHVDQGVGMRTDAPLWEAPGLPGLSAVRAFIPRDIANFQAKNWHWGDNPFKSLRGVRDGNPRAPVRIHGLVAGDRVVGHVLGCDFGAEIEARSAMRLTLGSWDGDEYAPVHEFEVRAGQQFFAPAGPDQIFVGKFI